MKQLILVVDGDAACRDALRIRLQASNFDVAVLYDPGKVAKRVEQERPSLIIMTTGTTLGCGLAALKALRGRGDDLPVIMLGERDDVTERIVGLECGADDFICKPFNVLEALARVQRVLARTQPVLLQDPASKTPFKFNGFELNFASRTLSFRGEAVPLSQTEYAMLNLFTTAPGQVLPREVIAQRVWPDAPHRVNAVSVAVSRLRRLIRRKVAAPELIHTVRAEGYVFLPKPDHSTPLLPAMNEMLGLSTRATCEPSARVGAGP